MYIGAFLLTLLITVIVFRLLPMESRERAGKILMSVLESVLTLITILMVGKPCRISRTTMMSIDESDSQEDVYDYERTFKIASAYAVVLYLRSLTPNRKRALEEIEKHMEKIDATRPSSSLR